MPFRRRILATLVSTALALGTLVIPAAGGELLGLVTKVDVENQKIVVALKDGKETTVSVTGDTEEVTKVGASRVNLEKLERLVKKARDAGEQGAFVKVEHEGGKVSKVYTGLKPEDFDDDPPPKKKKKKP